MTEERVKKMNDQTTPPEVDAEAVQRAEAAMAERGEPITERVQTDYFSFEETLTVQLPDGISWVQHQVMNEGKRRKYLNNQNRDVRLQRATGDALLALRPGDERYNLLKEAITGWNLQREGQPVPFTSQNLDKFLSSAPPKVIDLIDKEVRKANAWLIEDMSVEDIEKEIATLQELLETKREEEAGK